jgi:ribosomal protein S18 acetylase RimI-like enzyme
VTPLPAIARPGADAPAIAIRQLGGADFASYRALRLRGLAEHPEAFTSSAEEEATPEGDARIAARLGQAAHAPHDAVLGAFDADVLVGAVGLAVDTREKVRHRAHLFGMYVVPERTRCGIGRALLDAAIGRARATPGLDGLTLTVTAGNDRALRLYERAAFAVVGRDPDAVRVAGVAHDKLLLYRRL